MGFCGVEGDCWGKGFVDCRAPTFCPPNGMPVDCGKRVLWRKGFAPVIWGCKKLVCWGARNGWNCCCDCTWSCCCCKPKGFVLPMGIAVCCGIRKPVGCTCTCGWPNA